jgi:hypothetical protein
MQQIFKQNKAWVRVAAVLGLAVALSGCYARVGVNPPPPHYNNPPPPPPHP